MSVLILWLALVFGGQLNDPGCSVPVVVETDDYGISAMECVR